MKKLLVIAMCLATTGMFAQTGEGTDNRPELHDVHDSLNYFLGLSFGFSLGSADWETDAELIARGIAKVLEGNPGMDQETCQVLFRNLHDTYLKRQEMEADLEARQAGEKALEDGKEFLASNARKEGVFTTHSGLQYKIIERGKGAFPQDTSRVEVYYEGTLVDGTVFDSNFNIGIPRIFKLNNVIRGWAEGLQMMPVGSTYEFYIPPELAYGDRGAGPIPPNSVLIFKVKLMGIRGPYKHNF